MSLWFSVPLIMVTLGNVETNSSVHETVDLIELNHFHDEQGRPVYDQVIFYDWSASQAEYHVRAWCLVEPKEILSRRPIHSHHNDRHHVRWFDNDQSIHRHISSSLYRETWTQTDPERANKKILDERNRTALYKRPDKHATVKNKDAIQQANSDADVALLR